MSNNILSDRLYTISDIRQEGEVINCSVSLNPDHAVYKGHFPGQPVTPGVAFLYLIKDCISRAKGTIYSYQSIKSCKFLTAVNPTVYSNLLVSVQLKEDLSVQAQIESEAVVILKLKARIKQDV